MVTGDFEAVGDAVTGAVIARAVEPDSGTTNADARSTCLNCGALLVGAHCHDCGQKAAVHRTLRSYGHDLLHGVFHFEGKVWTTLPMLALRPGELTRRYIHGERAKFVSPLALFLFSVFLMFAVFETVGGPVRNDGTGKSEFNVNTSTTKPDDRIDTLTRERARLVAQKKDPAKIDAELAEERNGRDFALQIRNTLAGKPSKLNAGLDLDTGSAAMDKSIAQAFQNPKLLLYKLQSSAYKFAWALIPLSLPFMWLMFAWRPHYKLYDHAVFVTYSISFVMLLLIAMAVFGALGIKSILLLAALPMHFFLQLKGTYLLTAFSAGWRTIALGFVASFVLVAFGLFLLALGLMG